MHDLSTCHCHVKDWKSQEVEQLVTLMFFLFFYLFTNHVLPLHRILTNNTKQYEKNY